MITLQTNVDSMMAQTNLKLNQNFQSKTIQQLTSGYRINKSGDDAAGLAIANTFRSNITELTQGVSNANDGLSQLQIVDSGLNNISTILDRMKTLATQSASSTFTGNRATLNQEYQQLVKEVTRQASNINLNAGGSLNGILNVYIGGSSSSSNAGVTVDLSGSQSAVDATSLGLSTTDILAGGVGISSNTQRIDAPGATFVTGGAGTDDENFNFHIFSGGSNTDVTVKVAASVGSSTLDQVLSSLNGQLNKYGITAQVDNNGLLQFSGANAFTVTDAGVTSGGTAANFITSNTGGTASNTSNYSVNGQATYAAGAQTLAFQTSSGAVSVSLLAADSLDTAMSKVNSALNSYGVYAIKNAAGTGMSLQSSNSFSVNASAAGTFAASGNQVATAPTGGSSTNSQAAISALNNAILNLGLVQGRVGAGENKLSYAISLAQSQIANFSAAESQIRDTDVAAQAANLTKAQVLQQTSIAAMAQANAEPQSVLKLLQ